MLLVENGLDVAAGAAREMILRGGKRPPRTRRRPPATMGRGECGSAPVLIVGMRNAKKERAFYGSSLLKRFQRSTFLI